MLKWPLSSKTTAPQPPAEPLITPEADREIFRVMVIYGGICFALLMVMPIAMSFVNIPGTPAFASHRFLDIASFLVVMIPFFLGTNKVNAIKLRWGRVLVGERRWKEAVASLDGFARFGQQSFDGTGEAHYLLSTALAKIGEPVKAERARMFVLKHRATGPWAERLLAGDASRARGVSTIERVKPVERARPSETGETRARIVRTKKRRF